jgi:hypothetical protein
MGVFKKQGTGDQQQILTGKSTDTQLVAACCILTVRFENARILNSG